MKNLFKVEGVYFRIENRYTIYDTLMGTGSYGAVVEGYDKIQEEKIAIKKIHNVFMSEGDAKRILREIKLLKTINHSNIISLKNILINDEKNSFKEL
jgi:serine/threonine protein kinase